MRALDPEVFDVLWATIEPLIPPVVDTHPLGCHRPRSPDRDCFEMIIFRLATGCSWQDAERLCKYKVSDTTARSRRTEWVNAGVFDTIAEQATNAYDRIIGLDLTDVAVDGSQHKSPCGGQGTGPNPTDRGKLGWKWSILTDRQGIPLGWAVDGANRNDSILLEPTLQHHGCRRYIDEIDTIWLDRGYDSDVTRERLARHGITDAIIAKRRKRGSSEAKQNQPMGLRWPVERTNSWLSNFGQLRRNTDRYTSHRLGQLALAVACLLIAKLIDWRNRWSPTPTPIH